MSCALVIIRVRERVSERAWGATRQMISSIRYSSETSRQSAARPEQSDILLFIYAGKMVAALHRLQHFINFHAGLKTTDRSREHRNYYTLITLHFYIPSPSLLSCLRSLTTFSLRFVRGTKHTTIRWIYLVTSLLVCLMRK